MFLSLKILVGVGMFLLAVSITGCSSLPPKRASEDSHAILDNRDTKLGILSFSGSSESSEGLSGFQMLVDASLAFDARVAVIRNAEKSIDVQYYLIRDDETGLAFAKELIDAANRGVRVRLLIDDLYTSGKEELFFSLSQVANIEVRLFNPLPSRAPTIFLRLLLSSMDLLRINHRMHNKLIVGDNSMAVVGGRNIGNEYFMQDSTANFIDVDVLAGGPIVEKLSKTFDEFWNSNQVFQISELFESTTSDSDKLKRLGNLLRENHPKFTYKTSSNFRRPMVSQQILKRKMKWIYAEAHLYSDPPEKLLKTHAKAYLGSVSEGALSEISKSKIRVKIISPYFLPGPEGMRVIKTFATNGGEMILITNSLSSTDEPLTHTGYEKYRTDLLKLGVAVYEMAPQGDARTKRFGDFGNTLTRLHAKLAIFDDQRFFIGSMNMDHRSAAINTEVGLVIDSVALVKEFDELLDMRHIEIGYQLMLNKSNGQIEWLGHGPDGSYIRHQTEPGESLVPRLRDWFLLKIFGEELL